MKRAAIFAVLLAACSRASGSAPAPAASSSAAPAASAPAADGEIHFIENDYAAALAKARAAGKPLFIDTWAPWCHTCMSMRAYVFPDAKLRRLANEFVWLAIDFEREDNAATLKKFPAGVLPSLWVVDSATEKPALKWAGSATVSELEALLDDALAAVKHKDSGGEAAAEFVRGNQLSGEGKVSDAIDAYKKSLAAAPPDWKRRAQVVEALSMKLDEAKRYDEQIALATAELPKLSGTSLSNVLQNALGAAWSAPKGSANHAKLPDFVAQARKAAADLSQPMLADDRSSLYEHIVEALQDEDPKQSKEVAREWATYLEAQASAATTPEGRSVFDSHRLEAYIALGVPEKAVPMLEQSARDNPNDSNPPTRLARAYLELKKYDRAVAEVDRALSLAYGPRKLQVYLLKADILAARGDKAGERATLSEASKLAHASSDLPQRYAKMQDAIDGRLAKLDKK